MTWDQDERFTAWLDSRDLANDRNPLDEDTLDLMYEAWREGRRGRIADATEEAEKAGLYELSEHLDPAWAVEAAMDECRHEWGGSPAYLVTKLNYRCCFGPDWEVIGFRIRCGKCGKPKDVFVPGHDASENPEEAPSQPGGE